MDDDAMALGPTEFPSAASDDGPAEQGEAFFVAGLEVTPNLELVRPLGAGGMGAVWIAHHAKLDCEVAIKFISSRLLADKSTWIERFEREARISAKAKSPHIVQVFDHGTLENGTPFIVMELLEGESLADRLVREGTLSVSAVRLLVQQLAEALSAAHQRGIIHRDIKSANLFLVESGYEIFLKVLDFGIAKEVHFAASTEITRPGALLGTPSYMSPEQLLDAKDADVHSDLWPVAVVAYEALTGRLPFAAPTLARLAVALSSSRPMRPSELREGLPVALDRWFERALARAPEDRFTSASELAQSFLEATEQLPEPAEANRPPQTDPHRPRTSIGGDAGAAMADTIPSDQTSDTVDRAASVTDPRPSQRWHLKGIAAVVATVSAVAYLWMTGGDAPVEGPASEAATVSETTPAPSNTVTLSSAEPISSASPPESALLADPPPVSSRPTAAPTRPLGRVPRVARDATPKRPSPPPKERPAPDASSSPLDGAADCEKNPFVMSAEGVKIPRPECL